MKNKGNDIARLGQLLYYYHFLGQLFFVFSPGGDGDMKINNCKTVKGVFLKS